MPAEPSSTCDSPALPARRWRLRTRWLEFSRRPLLMGIVNVTPDSFSDGGRFLATDLAVEHGLRLASQGAAILDIGGESTRPYSQGVTAEEEIRRVLDVIKGLARQTSVPLSIDTSKAPVALASLDAGAEIVNDVTAFAGDPLMIECAERAQAGVCAMHMQGTPRTMQDKPAYADVIAEIREYLRARRQHLIGSGIDPERIALDPGIGFGKTHEHNLTLLANCRQFHELGAPLVVGHSRKGFIGKILGDKLADRTAGSVGVALSLACQGVQVLRVHDVAFVDQALRLFEATGGLEGE